MPEGGGGSIGESFAMVSSDLRAGLETLMKIQTANEAGYLASVPDTKLSGPARASIGFGFYGERSPLTAKQMVSSSRFFANYDTLCAQMREGLASPGFRASNPALADFVERTLKSAEVYIQSTLVQLLASGQTERSYIPPVVHSDHFSNLMRTQEISSEHLATERRLAMQGREAGADKEGILKRVVASLGSRAGRHKTAPYMEGA